jgi:hypothetical protein
MQEEQCGVLVQGPPQRRERVVGQRGRAAPGAGAHARPELVAADALVFAPRRLRVLQRQIGERQEPRLAGHRRQRPGVDGGHPPVARVGVEPLAKERRRGRHHGLPEAMVVEEGAQSVAVIEAGRPDLMPIDDQAPLVVARHPGRL